MQLNITFYKYIVSISALTCVALYCADAKTRHDHVYKGTPKTAHHGAGPGNKNGGPGPSGDKITKHYEPWYVQATRDRADEPSTGKGNKDKYGKFEFLAYGSAKNPYDILPNPEYQGVRNIKNPLYVDPSIKKSHGHGTGNPACPQ